MDLSVRIMINGCEFLLLLTLFQCLKLLLIPTSACLPCLVNDSSYALCLLSCSFSAPIPADCGVGLAEYTLSLTKVEELHFCCVGFPPSPFPPYGKVQSH